LGREGWLTPAQEVKLAYVEASEQKYGSAEQLPSVAAYPLFSSMITITCGEPGARVDVGAGGAVEGAGAGRLALTCGGVPVAGADVAVREVVPAGESVGEWVV
jgi:hypothetical protein